MRRPCRADLAAPRGRTRSCKWVAYQSNESARFEIYATSFPAPGGKRQISTGGGQFPRWRRDGKEMFYIAPDARLMAADVVVTPETIEVGNAHPLFGPLYVGTAYPYDVSADGRRILAGVPPEGSASQAFTLVQNWTAGLKK